MSLRLQCVASGSAVRDVVSLSLQCVAKGSVGTVGEERAKKSSVERRN
jgi:hypothetical protein